MKKQNTFLTVAFCVASFFASAQTVPGIQWQSTIGGNDYDDLYSVIQTTDGGYLLGGASYSGVSGDKTEASHDGFDYWVVKLAPEEILCSIPYGCNTTDISSLGVTLSWYDSIDAATSYRIYYKVKNDSIWTKVHAKTGQKHKTLKGLLPNTTYVWQVAANCSAIHSDFSPRFEFTTLTEKESAANLSNFNFSISPNPGNGRITIAATFGQEESLTIRVVDVLSREVFVEKEGIVNGNFIKQLDLNNFLPGSYFIQLIHNGKIETRKLVLLH